MRHAVRGLGRSPGFAATVVLALALGIGANTAMFSVVYGMLIRPLPYPDAGTIVRITEAMGPRMSRFVTSASMAALLDEAKSFEQLAGYGPASFSWRGPEGAVTLRAARVSPSMFPLLRATPHLGRLFVEEEARAGADRVVLLSHGAWARRFGSDPDIVGSAIELNNAPHTVVGVLADGFFFPSPDEEIWTPYVIRATRLLRRKKGGATPCKALPSASPSSPRSAGSARESRPSRRPPRYARFCSAAACWPRRRQWVPASTRSRRSTPGWSRCRKSWSADIGQRSWR